MTGNPPVSLPDRIDGTHAHKQHFVALGSHMILAKGLVVSFAWK